jgi:ABC-type transport system involved in multi-copper enzyme maturation permease subunit
MRGFGQIVLYSLRSILRTRFFWGWNASLVLLALSLNHITFFDFEENSLVPELFSATLMLSGAVNLVVYNLSIIRELSLGQWDLLILRPLRASQLVLGKLLAAMLFQLAVSLVLAGAHLLDSAWLGRRVSGSFWAGWYLALLQVATLGALYTLLSICLRELWAFVSMVGAFIFGQCTSIIYNSIIGNFSGWIFCFIPDLELTAKAGGDVPGTFVRLIFWKTTYSVFYLASLSYLSSLALKRRLDRP